MSAPYFPPRVLRITLSNRWWGMTIASGILQIAVCSYTSRAGLSQAKRILLKFHCSQCQGQAGLQLTKQEVVFISSQVQSPRKQLLGYLWTLSSGHHLESLRSKLASVYLTKCCVRWRVDVTVRVLPMVNGVILIPQLTHYLVFSTVHAAPLPTLFPRSLHSLSAGCGLKAFSPWKGPSSHCTAIFPCPSVCWNFLAHAFLNF